MAELTIKQKVLQSIEKLPQDVSIDDIIEHIYFMHKIEIGLKQSEKGELIDHEDLLKQMDKW
jgi:predicted transcriptional regulator